MRENCTSGSVRGAPGNGRSYRERAIKMNKKPTRFNNTKFSEIPKVRVRLYEMLAVSCFGLVGLITGEIKISMVGGCSAIVFIHFLGHWCDFVREGRPIVAWFNIIYTVIIYIITFIFLLGIADYVLHKYIW
jgi:ABC-type multidrug transport system permease subunit